MADAYQRSRRDRLDPARAEITAVLGSDDADHKSAVRAWRRSEKQRKKGDKSRKDTARKTPVEDR